MKRFLRKRWKLQHNAFVWVGVQGVVALSLLFAPIFLRRTHVILVFQKVFPFARSKSAFADFL
ncbi:hypothetical protein MAL08_17190 [Leptospira noguchii]|uniref:hypothetical protein n=1 Tax=Leptospira noguchii TaxID=28182 RepID=UPI001FB6E454|nr:hypothetical protein [Leptospira noguchii]UOG39603.1 hypothetical protein MAL08_17190 [Leptospira noguchii]